MKRILDFAKYSLKACVITVGLLGLSAPAFGALVITPTFTFGFNTSFGVNAAAAQAAWINAASVFSANFTDNIHVNITVNGVAGTSVFGQSSTFLNSTTYANMRLLMFADSKTPDDAISLALGGSLAVADPTAGAGTFWLSRAQGKAAGLIPDDLSNDGTTTFGAGNPFTFSGPIAAGTFDFQAVCAHEISEVMGRLGISGGTIGAFANSFSLIDSFSFTGPAARGMTPGPGENFSVDNGTTLLKLFNNAAANGLDTRDWAPASNDAFNQFANSGVSNPVSTVDLRVMDVIGYDRVVPEPGTGSLVVLGVGAAALARRRKPI
jgi:hypothetical protein